MKKTTKAKPATKPSQPNTNDRDETKLKLPFGWTWASCLEAHKRCAERALFSPDTATNGELMDLFFQANCAAHFYLESLRKQVPSEPNKGLFLTLPDFFEGMLLNHVRRLNYILCELARNGRHEPCEALWDEALKLTEVFSELALKNPSPFKAKARKSLFMPSIRAKNRAFTADAESIASAIELSAESVGDRLTDNRKRIGALCARLVGECVSEIKRARGLWAHLFIPYQKPIIWPGKEEIEPYFGKSIDQLICKLPEPRRDAGNSQEEEMAQHLRFYCMCVDCGTDRLHFLTLPELTIQTARMWWKEAIEKMVEARFPTLLENPAWQKELNDVSSGTRADKLKELKDYSRDKVKQFA